MHATRSTPSPSYARQGFSLTELLVVVAIIVLLVALLLVALGQVQRKAKRTETESRMQQFAGACSTFQTEQGRYPGVIPEEVLKHHAENVTGQQFPITCTENAILHMMGGYRVLSPTDAAGSAAALDYNSFVNANSTALGFVIITVNGPGGPWNLAVAPNKLGEGPVINGKPFAPYYTPGKNDLVRLPGQAGEGSGAMKLPDLADAWGQPIVYAKRVRDRGPLLKDTVAPDPPLPQFLLDIDSQTKPASVDAYMHRHNPSDVAGLGEMGMNQYFNASSNPRGSILSIGDAQRKSKVCAAILAHPAFYQSPNASPPGNPLYSAAKGAFVLISAGADGIFFSAIDGPGKDDDPIDEDAEIDLLLNHGPKAIELFDDIRVFGGG